MSFLKPSQYGVGISLAVYLQFALVYVFSLALFFLSLLWRSFFYLIRHVGRFMLALGWPQLNVGSTSLIGVPLPAPNSKRYRKKRYKLVLDLDETLVHTSVMKTAHYDLRVEVCGTKGSQVFYVLKRPYVDEFLFEISKHFEIVVFTASIRRYADPVIDLIDPNHFITYRYFRDSCNAHGNSFRKDLSIVSDDLSRTVVIDNAPELYTSYEENIIPIEAWYDDPEDDELLNFIPLLLALKSCHDVRSVIERRLSFKGPNTSNHVKPS